MSKLFQEKSVHLFGWVLGIVIDLNTRPPHWLFCCQWYRTRRVEFREWTWRGSHAALTLGLGPVAVDISVMRAKKGAYENGVL